MTFIQHMKETRSKKEIDDTINVCPYFFDLEKEQDRPCLMDDSMNCWDCWNREMPGNTDCRVADAPRNDEPKDDLVKDDPVNHPSHYTAGGVECIDAIAAALCKYTDGVDAWLAGQVIKYLWRSPLKGTYAQDLKKAQFYLNRLVKRQEGEK